MPQTAYHDIQITLSSPAAACSAQQDREVHLLIAPCVPTLLTVLAADQHSPAQRVRHTSRHVAIIPAGHAHSCQWEGGGEAIVMTISARYLARCAAQHGWPEAQLAPYYAAVDPFLWSFFRMIERQIRLRHSLSAAYLESATIIVGQHLLGNYSNTAHASVTGGGLPQYKLRRALDYIHTFFREDIGFRDIASELEMSPYHFTRLFKESQGESPHQCIMRCRIEAAKILLLDSAMSIVEITHEVGYTSQSYFTTRFALLTGVTPAAFRTAQKTPPAARGSAHRVADR